LLYQLSYTSSVRGEGGPEHCAL